MGKDLDIEDSDAFFNMRMRFWEQSRQWAVAEKELDKPLSQQSQEAAALYEDKERKKVAASGS